MDMLVSLFDLYMLLYSKMSIYYINVAGFNVMQNFPGKGLNGPLVVCVHGNSSCAETFLPLMKEFSETIPYADVIAFDLPGCGRSEALLSYSCQNVGRNIEQLLKIHYNANNRDVYYVGHSLGGHLEAFINTKKKGIVLIGTPPLRGAHDFPAAFSPNDDAKALLPLLAKEEPFTNDEAHKFVEHTFYNGEEEKQSLTPEQTKIMNEMVEYAKKTDGRFRKGCLETLASVNQLSALEERKDGSVVIIHGLRDGVISLDYLNAISKECLFKGKIHTVNSRHMVPILEFKFVAELIRGAFF